MDPDELLTKLRKYASDTGGEFAEAFEDLDEWLSKGGFPPNDWGHRFDVKESHENR